MKKLLAIMLAVLVLGGVLAVGASAWPPATSSTLVLDRDIPSQFFGPGTANYFTFTPSTSGTYKVTQKVTELHKNSGFPTEIDYGTYCTLVDSSGNDLQEMFFSKSTLTQTVDLMTGQFYYFRIRYFNSTCYGTINFRLELESGTSEPTTTKPSTTTTKPSTTTTKPSTTTTKPATTTTRPVTTQPAPSPLRYIGNTSYLATGWNWFMYIFLFGWIWMK